MADGSPLVEFRGVEKRFGGTLAVDRVDLSVEQGEFLALLGPSGCGKSTLLRLLAGFETPDAGRILLDGADLAAVPPHRRPINMMFQSYALFPHLNVADNIAFGLRRSAMSKPEIAARVAEMLALVKLTPLARRRPDQLSGGQCQRVALARALAKAPKLLLLDEPLAALDKKLREETQFELMEIQRRVGATFVVVTHDQEEAMALAGRVAVMDRGRILQADTPQSVYRRPASRFVAAFIGEATLIDGTLRRRDGACLELHWSPEAPPLQVAAPDGPAAALADGAAVCLALRPENVSISATRPEGAVNCVQGRLRDAAFQGDVSVFRVALENGLVVKAQTTNRGGREAAYDHGDPVWLSWDARAGALTPA